MMDLLPIPLTYPTPLPLHKKTKNPFKMYVTGAWTAKVQDSSQWLAVDLGREYVITKLQTQGRQGSGEYVSEYMFAFSNDAITWRYYTNEFGIREVCLSFFTLSHLI